MSISQVLMFARRFVGSRGQMPIVILLSALDPNIPEGYDLREEPTMFLLIWERGLSCWVECMCFLVVLQRKLGEYCSSAKETQSVGLTQNIVLMLSCRCWERHPVMVVWMLDFPLKTSKQVGSITLNSPSSSMVETSDHHCPCNMKQKAIDPRNTSVFSPAGG